MAIQAHMYSENLGFALGAEQQQQQPLMQFHHFQNISHPKNHKNVDFQHQSVPFSHTISAHIESQRMDIDRFINLQNERLRMALQEQRKHQISQLLKKYETKTHFLIKQKDEEITQASNRTIELQDYLRKIEIENQTWQRVAKENETMVASLTNSIERLRETSAANAAVEDTESHCIEEDNMTGHYDHDNEHRTLKAICRGCNSRNSCVVMLPCRHLCSCTSCDAFLDSCPVCHVIKKASIQALI